MPEYLNTVTVLRRTRKGDTYHRSECPRAKNALPWLWAEGRVRGDLATAKANGLRPCKVCDPDSALPERGE